MLPVIARTKFVIEFLLLGDEIVDLRQIFIPQDAQTFRDCSWIDHFRANKPERVNEGEIDPAAAGRPLLAEVPEMKVLLVFLSKANRLVTDEQAGAAFRNGSCRLWNKTRIYV